MSSDNEERRAKKPRIGASAFIDDAAQQSDDEGEGIDLNHSDHEEDRDDPNAPDIEGLIANDDDDNDRAVDESQPQESERRTSHNKSSKRTRHRDEEDDNLNARLFDQERTQREQEALARQVEARYGLAGVNGDLDDDYDYDDYDADDLDAGNQQQVLPSIADPKLFLLKCDPGKEDECVHALLQRYYNAEEMQHDRLFIYSAFTTPASKGYVYVEADKLAHVQRAARGMRALKAWSAKQPIPISEMVSAVTFSEAGLEQPVVGQWCRVKKGLYKGDLARIVKLADQSTRVTCKLIPRIDHAWIEFRAKHPDEVKAARARVAGKAASKLPEDPLFAQHHEDPNAGSMEEQQKRRIALAARRALQTHPSARPEPRLFSRADVPPAARNLLHRTNDGYDEFAGGRYKRGFLFKEFPLQQLQVNAETLDVRPDEVEKFAIGKRMRRERQLNKKKSNKREDDEDDDEMSQSDDDDDRNLSAAALEANAKALAGPGASSGVGARGGALGGKQHAIFSLNDRVIVVSGPMKNITGRLVSLLKDHATLKPDPGQPIRTDVDLVLSELRKFFRLGDHVKVERGPYKDETGMITQVKESIDAITIYSDTSLRELTVRSSDIIESSEVSRGQDTFGDYQLFDLVQLAGDIVGLIVRVQVSSFVLLTNRGQIEHVRLQEIGKKRNTRLAASLDRHNAQLTQGDMVMIQMGPHAGRKGVIKHIYQRTLFMHDSTAAASRAPQSSQQGEANGCFVAQAQHCAIVGGEATMRASQQQQRSDGAAAAMNRLGPRDPIMHQSVIVIAGPYKSFLGRVCGVTGDGAYRVELHALNKKVACTREQIEMKQNIDARQPQAHTYGSTSSGGFGGDYASSSNRSQYLSAQTPLLGQRTPHHSSDMLGASTPFHSMSSRTPNRAAATPSRFGADGEDAYAAASDVWKVRTPDAQHRRRAAHDSDEDSDEDDQRQDNGSKSQGRHKASPDARGKSQQEQDDDDEDAESEVEYTQEDIASRDFTWQAGCECKIRSLGDKHAIVQSCDDKRVTVRLDGKSESEVFARRFVWPIQPVKEDFVCVIASQDFAGQKGKLVGVNGDEGIMELEGGDNEIAIVAVQKLTKWIKP